MTSQAGYPAQGSRQSHGEGMSSPITFKAIFTIRPNPMFFRGVGGDVIQFELDSTHPKTYLLHVVAYRL